MLRCGVARPRSLRPTSELIEINSVRWFLQETHGAYVFTTYGRVAFVEVRVPTSVPRERATAPLVDLARPLIASVPVPTTARLDSARARDPSCPTGRRQHRWRPSRVTVST